MYPVVLSRRAHRTQRDLPAEDARRVADALVRLQRDPRTMGVIKLTGLRIAEYRLQVGNYRILFDIDDEASVVEVLDIRRRSEGAYR
ncbi:MAG: type II toxin-antitoxin system RelE/ParE family toxin [Dehalococcoidia bacterium]|nr:type II toxin-antitoxin system RelE/ParE family toxin [Dehalococcoidia bacterium]